MNIYSATDTASKLPFPTLIEQMRQLFAAGLRTPDRHSHRIPIDDEPDATMLLMPAWHKHLGCVKIVNVTPDNGKRNLPAVIASILIFNRHTGEHLAMLDGDTVTVKRTAAASALAADYLAPQAAEKLLIIGAGQVADQLAEAFSVVRPIQQVQVWNRTISKAEKLVDNLNNRGFNAALATDLETAVRRADIISAATLSTEPLIKGEWLRDNQHIDLIGAFTPTMREADNEVFRRANGIFIDTTTTAKEAGELRFPLEAGIMTLNDIHDLYELTSDKVGRPQGSPVTIFKSAGCAVMDMAAAMTAMA